MPFTLNMTGVGQVDDSIVQAYDQQFIIANAQEQIMDQFVSYKKQINAKSIEFEKYSQLALATTALTEDEDPTSEAVADSNILLQPVEYGKVVTKTALSTFQTGGKIDLAIPRLVGINSGRTLDKLALLALDASSNVQFAGSATSNATLADTHVMDVTFLNKLYNKLARESVPMINGMYVAVMHDDQINDLRASASGWQDIMKYSKPEEVLANEIGALGGFRIIRDNHATITAGASLTGKDVYNGYFFGFNALGKAVSSEVEMVATQNDKLNRFLHIGWKACLKYGIVDQSCLHLGRSVASVAI